MTDTTTMMTKYKTRTDDEFGVHILEDLAGWIASNQDRRRACLNWFAVVGEMLVEIDTLLAHDVAQASTMKKSRGVLVSANMEQARKIDWTVKAFRDPVRLAILTHQGDLSLSETYLNVVQGFFVATLMDLKATNHGGGTADLACNKGLRRFYIDSLRKLSHDLDFEFVYNVYTNSNLTGDTSKPDWFELIDKGTKKPPSGPRGGGPNNGGTPKGALVPFPSMQTNLVADSRQAA